MEVIFSKKSSTTRELDPTLVAIDVFFAVVNIGELQGLLGVKCQG